MKIQEYFPPSNRTPFVKSLRISCFQDVARKTCSWLLPGGLEKNIHQHPVKWWSTDTREIWDIYNPKPWKHIWRSHQQKIGTIFGLGPSSIDKTRPLDSETLCDLKNGFNLSQPNKNIRNVKNWQLPAAKRAWYFWENSRKWTSWFFFGIHWPRPTPPKKKQEQHKKLDWN